MGDHQTECLDGYIENHKHLFYDIVEQPKKINIEGFERTLLDTIEKLALAPRAILHLENQVSDTEVYFSNKIKSKTQMH